MALSGTVKTSTYDGRYYQLDWKATQSEVSNQSTVSWTLKAVGGSGWYAERTLTVVLGGSTVYSKTDRVQRYAGTIKTGTKTIAHDSSGNANFSVSIQAAVYGTSINCTGSGSFTLDTIPRKSSLSVENGTLGTKQTLTVSRATSSFTHTITATCGSVSTTICTKSATTSIEFTPPIGWASQNTSGASVSVEYRIITYNGDTSVGTNSYTVSCVIPASVKPSCTVSVTDPTGYADTYGGFIKGVSKFAVTVSPETSYNSPITAYSTTANGGTYTVATFTTGELKSSGALTINATVKDKRGRTGSASVTKNVLEYKSPQINSLAVSRCNSDGTANQNGDFAKVTFNASVTALSNKNTAKYTLKYKKTSETAYTSVELTNYTGKYSITGASYIFSADSGSSYDVKLEILDAFTGSNPIYRSTSVSTGFTLMHWLASGLGMALGKVAELANTFEVNFNSKFYKNVDVEGIVTLTKNVKFNSGNITGMPVYIWDGVEYGQGVQIGSGGAVIIGSGESANNLRTNMNIAGESEQTYITSDNNIRFYTNCGTISDKKNILSLFKDGSIQINENTLADYVVAQGTSGIWTYRKWNSGIAECWGNYSFSNVNCAELNYSGWYYSSGISVPLPITLTEAGTVIAHGGSNDFINFIKASQCTTTKVQFWICALQSVTSASGKVWLNVKGRWK